LLPRATEKNTHVYPDLSSPTPHPPHQLIFRRIYIVKSSDSKYNNALQHVEGESLELPQDENRILRKKKRRLFLKTFILLLVLFSLFITYNAYTTVEGLRNEGVKIDDDPKINTETKTLTFWIELKNDGYLPVTLDINVIFTDLRHDKHIGEAQQRFEMAGGASANKTFRMTVDDEFVDYAEGENGLYIEILPTITGTYAGFIPIPETSLEAHKVIIRSDGS